MTQLFCRIFFHKYNNGEVKMKSQKSVKTSFLQSTDWEGGNKTHWLVCKEAVGCGNVNISGTALRAYMQSLHNFVCYCKAS